MKKYISLQTKVSTATNVRFQAAAQRAGLKSGYELMQVLVTAFLRVADPEHEPVADEVEETAEKAKWAEMFAGWEDQTKRLNTARPYRERDEKLDEAVLLFKQPGTCAYSVRRITMNDETPRTIDRNVDATINAMIRKLRPKTNTDLLEIGRACGKHNLMEIVEALLEDTTIPRVKDNGEGVLPGMSSVYEMSGYVRHNNKEVKG